MKVLVTGGAGFVGSHLTKRLLTEGHKVTVFDNLSRTKNNLPLIENAELVVRDIGNVDSFLQSKKFDLIYHLAAQVAVTTSYEKPYEDFRVNADGTMRVLCGSNNFTDKSTPVIFASTNKVYGDNVNVIPLEELETRYDFMDLKSGIHEGFPLDAKHHTPYGVSKLAADQYVRDFGGVVNRFSCMYGTHQYGNEDQGWVAHFIISKLQNKPLTIFGDGKTVRDLLYVDDVVNLLVLEGQNIDKIRGTAFNIGGGPKNLISLNELCDYINLKPAEFKEERPADQKVYYSDIRKVKHILGWEPKIGVYEGIDRLQNWAKDYFK